MNTRAIAFILLVPAFLLALILFVPFGLAANDPGHDTLYVEQEGDSELTGNLNITSNLIVQGDTEVSGLELYGDGTDPSSGAYISVSAGGSDWMRIDTPGNLYLKDGGGDQIQVGSGALVTDLNVTGVIYEQNVRVCLSNGTNCVGGNNTGNVSSVTGGTGITVSGTASDPVVNIDGTVCTTGNGLCPDTNTQLSEATVESYIFDADNTGSLTTTGELQADNVATTSTGASLGESTGTLGTYSIYIGSNAGASSTASGGIFMGYRAGRETSGLYPILIGYEAGRFNTQNFLTAVGHSAAHNNSGSETTAFGYYAGNQNTAQRLSAFGFQAGNNNRGEIVSVMGYNAGADNEGRNIVGIGQQAASENTANNTIAIGYQAGYQNSIDNQFILKQGNVNSVPLLLGNFSSGNVGIGYVEGNNPLSKLGVNGSINVTSGNDICITGGNCLSAISGGSGGPYGWGNTSTTVSLDDANNNVSAGALFIDNAAGYVGIGTTSPSVTLHINGTVVSNEINVSSTNVIIGTEAGVNNSGTSITLVGYRTGYNNTTNSVTAIGDSAGHLNTRTSLTAVGRNAGRSNSGAVSSAIGYSAGNQNSGDYLSAVGYLSGYLNSGNYLVAVGRDSGRSNQGNYTVGIGFEATRDNSGNYVVGIGYQAGELNTGTEYLNAIGYNAGYQNSGDNIMAIGYYAGYQNSGDNNIFLGDQTGWTNSGTEVVAVGSASAFQNSGSHTSSIGYQAGAFNSGDNVTTIGYQAGYQNSGDKIIVVGELAGYQNIGHNNSFIGIEAGLSNEGNNSIGIGHQAGYGNKKNNLISIGQISGYANNADNAITIGRFSGFNNSGENLIAQGYFSAGYNTGENITAIGYVAGYQNTGTNGIFIGEFAGFTNTLDNQFVLKVNTTNEIPLISGNFSSGNVGIGYVDGMNPTAKLGVNGTINVTSGNDVCITGGNCLSAISGGSADGNASSICGDGTFLNGDGTCDAGFLDADGTDDDVPESGDFGAATDLDATGAISADVVDGTELADTITLDANLAINGYNTTFDSGTLFIDSTNNRVGVGTTSPNEELDVTGNISASVDICVDGGNCLSDMQEDTVRSEISVESAIFDGKNEHNLITSGYIGASALRLNSSNSIISYLQSNGSVTSAVEISNATNGGPSLDSGDQFGFSITPIGDLDGDGILDLAVGARNDEGSGSAEGAVYILFMEVNGSVASTVKITDGQNGGPSLDDTDAFGTGIANIGDLDGDGVTDLIVGAALDESSGSTANEGAVYTLFMYANGSVKSTVKISDNLNGGPSLGNDDYFGWSVTTLGDLNQDGIVDIAVGAMQDESGSSSEGAVHILFMNKNGSAASTVKIGDGENGGPSLDGSDFFGSGVANIGDLDEDGITDLAVGAMQDESGSSSEGAVHILFMNKNGSVRSTVKIGDGENGGPSLDGTDSFGSSIANIGDLNGDGITDIAVSALFDEGTGSDQGAIHLLFMNKNGSVQSTVKIADGENGGPSTASYTSFGRAIANIGDLNGDGIIDLIAGEAGKAGGSIHVLFLQDNSRFRITTNNTERLTITQSGNVGIGTSTPTHTFNVVGDANITGNLMVGGNLSDLAETIFASEEVVAGDVVTMGADLKVHKSRGAYEKAVVGVVSTAPATVFGGSEAGDTPLAISGRVPVKVTNENGMIEIGDLLTTSSTPGHAMKCNDITSCFGKIIGKAITPQKEEVGIVTMMIMLN